MTSEELVIRIPQEILVLISLCAGAWVLVFVAASMVALFSDNSRKRADARKVMRMVGVPHRMITTLARRDDVER